VTVGVFDSGVGGLSVLVPLLEQVPCGSFLYLADQAWCPYGPRPASEIRTRSVAVSEALLQAGAQLIVVACNSASSAALSTLRERFPDTPFVGMEPAVKPAAERTRTGHVGVLATAATARGERLARLIDRFGRGVTVHVHVPTGLVELIEAGAGQSDQATALLAPTFRRWRTAGVDTVVLGCTHYPFARATVESLLGPDVEVIDPAPAVARQAMRVLGELPANGAPRERTLTFLTTGDPAALETAVRRMAGAHIADVASFRDAAHLRLT
jgi:glutamate racemase